MTSALVIDDNRQPADILCQLLNLLDIKARPAYSPRAAIMALRDEIPDIVFLDINMPGVDGFEVMSYLRREPRFINIPIVIVTGDDSQETDIKSRLGGAVDVIVKPASLEALEDALRAAKLA